MADRGSRCCDDAPGGSDRCHANLGPRPGYCLATRSATYSIERAHMAEQKQPGEKQAEPLYLPADFYLLRAPALPAQVFIDLSSAGHVGGETAPGFAWSGGETACTALLLRWVARPEVQQALAIASPSLLEGLQRVQRGAATP